MIPDFEANASLFAVFDGHNGVEVASYCSKYLPDYILSNKKYQSGEIVEGLKEAFLLLDNGILLRESIEELIEIRQKKHPELPLNSPGITSGCTAVICLLKKGIFYCASIGDSRCVLCRSGQAFPLSMDNKPDELGEQMRIVNAGGVVVQLSAFFFLQHCFVSFTLYFFFRGRINRQINVSRAFGDHMFKAENLLSPVDQMITAMPEVVVETFIESTDSFLVLMCDGIWNSMDNDQVIKFVDQRIKKQKQLAKINEELIDQILPKVMPHSGIKGKDNMTFMIISFKSKR